MTPQPWSEASTEHGLGRFLLEKKFSGDLGATSQGQMLSAGTGGAGSSGVYVALEKVTGSLGGRNGSFVLYHTGVMNGGVPTLSIAVSPGSGTGDLEGISGTMTIERTDGKHSYELSYSLPKAG
jgi:hypothetical protein